MSAYLQSGWVKFGLVLLFVGAAPLLFIVVAAAIGLWPDPNPNPIGPGLLFFFTFWPAVVRRLARRGGRPPAGGGKRPSSKGPPCAWRFATGNQRSLDRSVTRSVGFSSRVPSSGRSRRE